MKFKKTKLTALAMSVLMAASTITSVTWAADLFTDGAPAEVVVEAPVAENAVLDIPEVEVAEETQLLDATTYVVDKPDVAQDNSNPLEAHKFGETGVYKETNGPWVLYYNYLEEDGTSHSAGSNGDAKRYVLKEEDYTYTPATCVKKATITLHITELNDSMIPVDARKVNSEAYEFGSIDENAHGYAITLNPPVDSNVTEKSCVNNLSNEKMHVDAYKYEAYSYVGCEYCKRVYDAVNDVFKDITPDGTDYSTIGGKDTYSFVEAQVVGKYGVEKITTYPQHNFSDWKYAEITTADIDKVYPKDESTAITPISDKLKTKATVKEAAQNAKVTNNNLDVYDRTKPAIVRRYKECSRCGYVDPEVTSGYKDQWYLFWTGEKEETSTFYMYDSKVLSNIKGFVGVVKDGKNLPTLGILDETDSRVSKLSDGTYIISPDNCKGVALKNCKLGGLYYECHFINDYTKEYVIDKPIPVSPQEHAYGSVYVDISKSDTQIDDLAKDKDYGSNGIKVKRDANGNVTEAYSNNCTKEAKYVLTRECLNCGEKQVVSTLTTAKGDHQFSDWLVDESKTVYTKIDSTQHLVHYMDSRVCKVCGIVETRDSEKWPDVKEAHGELKEKKIDDGLEVEATCGTDGSYNSGRGCTKCDYVIEETITPVVVPATDKHDFGTNEPYFRWVGEVQIGSAYNKGKRNVTGQVVRECTVCGKADSNGIGGVKPGYVGGEAVSGKVDVANMIPAKKNPATGVAYSCSVDKVPIVVEWKGYVDGVIKEFTETKVVPYYEDEIAFNGKTAHIPGSVKIENRVEPTTEKDGSYDEVIYCTVCGDEYSRKTVTVPKDIEVTIPTVTATAVNYNTVNVSWTPVEGATSYRLYYRSADLGITTWHRVRTLKGTSFTHSGLTTGARYRYTVRAEVNGKLGDYSRTGSVARPLPAAPEMKSVTAVSNGTKVTWSKVDGADGYIIFRKTTGAFTRVGAVSRGSKVTWTDKKPVSGATYKVRAYRTVDNVNYKGAFSAAK